MARKKKTFTKQNSVKFLLLRGNPQATNADGEILQNILVPVSSNYKPGTSLLMSNIAALNDLKPVEDEIEEEGDLKEIMGQFDSESEHGDLSTKMERMTFGQKFKKSKLSHPLQEENFQDSYVEDAYSDVDSQFSDASDSFDSKCKIPEDCPENLKLFNARFEKVFEEYEEDQIGPLDDEEICGYLCHDSKRAKDILDSGMKHEEQIIELGHYDENLKERILNYAEDSGDEKIVEIVTEKPLEFDCESILSTYSNIYNHPTVIREEKVQKIKIPNNPLKKRLTKTKLKTLESESEDDESDDDVSVATSINVRQKNETPEERRQRKTLFKEAKRESRILKKENKLAFTKEKKLHKAQLLNSQRNCGIKLL